MTVQNVSICWHMKDNNKAVTDGTKSNAAGKEKRNFKVEPKTTWK